MNQPRDKGLNGNEKIEQAVAALQLSLIHI